LLLTTRREALTQVLGYLVPENGIFIFGLLLIDALPLLARVAVVPESARAASGNGR